MSGRRSKRPRHRVTIWVHRSRVAVMRVNDLELERFNELVRALTCGALHGDSDLLRVAHNDREITLVMESLR